MSLFSYEEICKGCPGAIFHHCCGKFCKCVMQATPNHVKGYCRTRAIKAPHNPSATDPLVELEREENVLEEGGYKCDVCGRSNIDSMHLHRHLCPYIPEHMANYDRDELIRTLEGETMTRSEKVDKCLLYCKSILGSGEDCVFLLLTLFKETKDNSNMTCGGTVRPDEIVPTLRETADAYVEHGCPQPISKRGSN